MSDATMQGLMVSTTLLATGGLGLWLAAPTHSRATALGMALIGWFGMLTVIAPAPLRERPITLGAGIVATLAIGATLAWLLRRHTAWLLVLGAVALPLRLPVPLGGDTYNLLLPLYGVVGVTAFQLFAREYRVARGSSVPRAAADGRYARLLDIAVALLVVYAGASIAWSIDRAASTIEVGLFIVPFTLMYIVLRDWRAAGALGMRAAGAAFAVVMSVAALIGVLQHELQFIWQNNKVEIANTYSPNFRTNSIFWDPNIYGRYLVLALFVLVGAVIAHGMQRADRGVRRADRGVRRADRGVRRADRGAFAQGAAIVGGSALLLIGLWYSYSQSSMLALAAGACAWLVLLLSRRGRATVLVLLGVALLLSPIWLSRLETNVGAESGGRLRVLTNGLTLAAYHPVRGIGVGSFPAGIVQLAQERGERIPRLRASHATPVTVLVEQGLLGVMIYAGLLGSVIVVALEIVPSPGRRERLSSRHTAPSWAVSAIIALVAHSIFYAGFFEDPALWVALALLAPTPNMLATARTAAPPPPAVTNAPTAATLRASAR